MVEGEHDPGAQRNWWRAELEASDWRHVVRVSIAAALCYELTRWFGAEEGWWAAITSIVVLQSQVGNTLQSAKDRLIGTAIGALLGWPVSIFWHGRVIIYALAVALVLLLCNLFRLGSAGRLGAVALSVIVLIHFQMSPGRAALLRFFEVAIGVIVALIVRWTVFPGDSSKVPAT
jgi:uncharacterized membrane protein YccC